MADEDTLGSIINKRALPIILLVLAGLLLVLSFAVGWFSIDATLRRWAYDPESPPDYDGAFIPPLYRIDLEMRMLSIQTDASPNILDQRIQERGEPNYDDHAGRMGTIMLGVLLMQSVILLCFVALAGFYALHRRGKRDYGPVVKRLTILFAALLALSLLYFSVRIGGAARDDEQVILSRYTFNDQVAYATLRPDIGFWKEWRSDKVTVTLNSETREVWQFEVQSNPSAGWWLSVAALGCVIGARIMAQRNGDFESIEDVSGPDLAPPNPAAG